jgi:hypothetical protein
MSNLFVQKINANEISSNGEQNISLENSVGIPDGTFDNPSIKFNNEVGSGIYRESNGNLGISVLGQKKVNIGVNGITTTAYPPGTAIETLWGLCDGSTHSLLSGNYTVQSVTAAQGLSTTFADITGSSISYVPPVGATKVVYRFTFSNYWVGSHAILHLRFLIDGVEVTQSRHNRSATYNEQRYPFEWVIGIGGGDNPSTGRQNIWTTLKNLKMQARWYSGSNHANLHGTTYWDGTGSNQFNVPLINIIAMA